MKAVIMNNFYITVNASSNKFTYELPYSYEIDHTWKACLIDYCFQPKISTFSLSNTILIELLQWRTIDFSYKSNVLEMENFDNIYDIVVDAESAKKLGKAKFSSTSEMKSYTGEDFEGTMDISYKKIDRFQFPSIGFKTVDELMSFCNGELERYNLQFINHSQKLKLIKGRNIRVTFSNGTNQIFGVERVLMEGSEVIFGTHEIKLIPDYMILLCDVLKNSLYDSTPIPILKRIPNKSYGCYECSPKQYINMKALKELKKFDFEIITEDGELFPFEKNQKISFTIHFTNNE